MKDAALAKGARIAINRFIGDYGEMSRLRLDSVKKSIETEVMLEGEREPLTVHIGRYELTEADGRYLLRLYGIRTSRAWMDALAASYLEGKAFEIPAEYAKLLKVVV